MIGLALLRVDSGGAVDEPTYTAPIREHSLLSLDSPRRRRSRRTFCVNHRDLI